jgi:putative YhbY family RNA-binding protein
MPALTSARRSELRAQAHDLAPVVIVGDKGLTPAVLAEVDRALTAHELIKVRAATDDREARAAWMAQLCAELQAQPVQTIGKVLVLWRENPDKAKKKEPAAKPVPKADPRRKPKASTRQKKHRTAEELIRTERLRSRALSSRPASEPQRRRPRTSR